MMKRAGALALIAASLSGALAASPQGETSSALSLVLAIDVSASTDFRTTSPPRDVSDAIDSGLMSGLTADDRFGVVGFGATAKFSGFVPGDRRARLESVRRVFRDRTVGLNGPSRVWDAVDEAVAHLETVPQPRAIILMTDGRATGNRLGLDAIIRHAQSAGVAVSVLGSGSLRAVPNGYPELEPHLALERLASETGGLFRVDEVGDTFRQRRPGGHLEAILEFLRTRSAASMAAPTR